ncbi:hypothetical protein [Halomonas icarae]|nr:hypothetical protein [Halomonas icarae]MDR5900558.1 hypothetical protein [Halomonas icarae]
MELIESVFYRKKGPYLVGRIGGTDSRRR